MDRVSVQQAALSPSASLQCGGAVLGGFEMCLVCAHICLWAVFLGALDRCADAFGLGFSKGDVKEQPGSGHCGERFCAFQRGKAQSWKAGGMLNVPLSVGVISSSWGSTTDFKVKFCKMVVMNKNISMRARPSPGHIRFPGSENSKQGSTAAAE